MSEAGRKAREMADAQMDDLRRSLKPRQKATVSNVDWEMSDQDQSIALVNRLYAEVAALQAELQIVKDNYAACHSQYCAGRAVANALRAERDEHIRAVEEARYAAVKAKHVAEDEARILHAEVEWLRGALRDIAHMSRSDAAIRMALAALEAKP